MSCAWLNVSVYLWLYALFILTSSDVSLFPILKVLSLCFHAQPSIATSCKVIKSFQSYIYIVIMTLSLTVLGGCLDHKTRNKKLMRIKQTRQGVIMLTCSAGHFLNYICFSRWTIHAHFCLQVPSLVMSRERLPLIGSCGSKKTGEPCMSHSPLHWQRLFCRRRLEYVGHTCLGEKSSSDMFNYRVMSFLILPLGVAQVQKFLILK